METVLRRQPERIPGEDAADASGLTVAMVLLACVLAAVVSQVSTHATMLSDAELLAALLCCSDTTMVANLGYLGTARRPVDHAQGFQ